MGHSTSVLLVEDEVLIRLDMALHLRDHGYTVFEAATAEDAVQILKHDQISINVVFSDVYMPGRMNGLALAQWVRQEMPGLVVLLASGEDVRANLPEGVSFLAKPYEPAAVVEWIRLSVAKSASEHLAQYPKQASGSRG